MEDTQSAKQDIKLFIIFISGEKKKHDHKECNKVCYDRIPPNVKFFRKNENLKFSSFCTMRLTNYLKENRMNSENLRIQGFFQYCILLLIKVSKKQVSQFQIRHLILSSFIKI